MFVDRQNGFLNGLFMNDCTKLIRCRCSHCMCLCCVIVLCRDTRISQLSGRDEVLDTPSAILASGGMLISGHHGKTFLCFKEFHFM